jgi:hypothetical protein
MLDCLYGKRENGFGKVYTHFMTTGPEGESS